MGYRFQAGEPLAEGVRRIARGQVDKASEYLRNGDAQPAESAHETRKCCKRMRGLLRLSRHELGNEIYRAENVAFRDIARELASLREADALLETLDLLRQAYPRRTNYLQIQEALEHKHRQTPAAKPIQRAKAALQRAHGRIAEWPLDADAGFAALAPGLRKTYARARKGHARALADPSTENLHEWRKRVKYHWYHVRLLQPIWPEALKVRRGACKDLSDLLGDDHDLAEFHMSFADDEALREVTDVDRLERLVADYRTQLQRQSFVLGARLFEEKPKAFTGRMHGYWRIWGREFERAG